MRNEIINLSDNNFNAEVLKTGSLILIDFWAEWCNPCKSVAPILDDIANEYQGKLVVAKLNVDQSPETTSKYGIRGIPTLLLFSNGEAIANRVGTFTKSQLKEFIDSHLTKSHFQSPKDLKLP